ncbi:12230_t:CDS:2, partial [Acaulospora colombiana]
MTRCIASSKEDKEAINQHSTHLYQRHNRNANANMDIAQPIDSNHHLPTASHGTTPLAHWELWKDALISVILTIHITIQQDLRVAQGYYLLSGSLEERPNSTNLQVIFIVIFRTLAPTVMQFLVSEPFLLEKGISPSLIPF